MLFPCETSLEVILFRTLKILPLLQFCEHKLSHKRLATYLMRRWSFAAHFLCCNHSVLHLDLARRMCLHFRAKRAPQEASHQGQWGWAAGPGDRTEYSMACLHTRSKSSYEWMFWGDVLLTAALATDQRGLPLGWEVGIEIDESRIIGWWSESKRSGWTHFVVERRRKQSEIQ